MPAVTTSSTRGASLAAAALRHGFVLLGILLAQTPSTYDVRRDGAVEACTAINASESRSGLYGNPDGYRSFYVRSKCFQDAAVRFRDATLCEGARQRRSLFASSWGYSPANCRRLVNEGMANDRRELERLKADHAGSRLEVKDVRVERNGNGRDFDIIPTFGGAGKGSYRVTMEILPGGSRPAVTIYSSGHYLDASANLRLYVTGAEIRRRLADFVPGGRYTVRVTLALSVPAGSPSAQWSDAFVESVFPVRERSRTFTRELAFGSVRPRGVDRLRASGASMPANGTAFGQASPRPTRSTSGR